MGLAARPEGVCEVDVGGCALTKIKEVAEEMVAQGTLFMGKSPGRQRRFFTDPERARAYAAQGSITVARKSGVAPWSPDTPAIVTPQTIKIEGPSPKDRVLLSNMRPRVAPW